MVDDRLKIDFGKREVWVDGELVKLRPTEYRLLYHLVQNAGWVLTYDQILTKVWGYEYRDETHYVRLYINYLRQKLENALGAGYAVRFTCPDGERLFVTDDHEKRALFRRLYEKEEIPDR